MNNYTYLESGTYITVGTIIKVWNFDGLYNGIYEVDAVTKGIYYGTPFSGVSIFPIKLSVGMESFSEFSETELSEMERDGKIKVYNS